MYAAHSIGLGEVACVIPTTSLRFRNPIEKYRVEKMAECRTICCCIYLFINFLSLSTIYVSYINVLDAEKYEKFNTKYNVTSTYRIYPYHMYFPFDTSVSHGFYWLGYFYQIYAYCSTMLTFLRKCDFFKIPFGFYCFN